MYDTTCDLFWLESSGCRQTPYVLRVCKGVIRHITRNPFEIEVTSAQLNLQSSVKPMFASNLEVKRVSCIKVCDVPLVFRLQQTV